MPSVGLEPTIPASARPQTYALDRAATGIGLCVFYVHNVPEGYSICHTLVKSLDRCRVIQKLADIPHYTRSY
jgi:hypothetical protein